jgi:hypothetical protein
LNECWHGWIKRLLGYQMCRLSVLSSLADDNGDPTAATMPATAGARRP